LITTQESINPERGADGERMAQEEQETDSCGCSGNPVFDGVDTRYKAVLWIVIALNAAMFIVEMLAGKLAGSQALQADALDFLGDAMTYGISLAVIGMSLRTRAKAALFKGASLAAMGLWVLGSTIYQTLILGLPKAEIMGVIGFVLTLVWIKFIHNPPEHPNISKSELEYLKEGGAVVDIDHKKTDSANNGPKWSYVRQMLSSRMMLGIFFGQYFINSITWFFLTWFPIYLVQEKGMSILKVGMIAAIPALCGFAGGVLGGVFSDFLIKRGFSLTVARKIPIVLGMLLATSIILCNYTDNNTLVVTLMALAFFGKGFGALGWPVIADTAPKEVIGLCGGIFNVFGNVASIVTPLVIGYMVKGLHSFNMALIFVGCSALMAMLCYLLVVGDIKRLELKKQ